MSAKKNLNTIDIEQVGSRYCVHINGAQIGGVTSYSVSHDSNGHTDLTLTISFDGCFYASNRLLMEQPTQKCSSD